MNKYVFKGYQDFLDMKVPIIEVEGQNRRVMLGLTFEKLVAARSGQINRLIKEEDLTNTAKGIIDVGNDTEFIKSLVDNNVISKQASIMRKKFYIVTDQGCTTLLKKIKTKTERAKYLNNKLIRKEYFI